MLLRPLLHQLSSCAAATSRIAKPTLLETRGFWFFTEAILTA
jgi:hypothetical protein